MDTTRFLIGPVIVEPTRTGGATAYEVWDNGPFSFHMIERMSRRTDADALAAKLNAAIKARRPRPAPAARSR